MEKVTRRDLLLLGAVATAGTIGLRHANARAPIGRTVTVVARPEAITIDTAQTAVIVVDMQNDFGVEGGMFHRSGIDISGIQKAVAPTAHALDVARRAGITIVYLKMAYRPDLADLGAPDSVNRVRHLQLGVGQAVTAPDGTESRVLIRDTWNSAILDELKPHPEDLDSALFSRRFLCRTGLSNLISPGEEKAA